jgi:2Fe-2S ferredoxin
MTHGPVSVRVEPSGLTIAVEPGETVAAAAWRQGFRWPTTCWGKAECMVCAVEVVAGEDATVPPDPAETTALRTLLARQLRRPGSRLACRLRLSGAGVVVRKNGVRPPGAAAPPVFDPGSLPF